MILEVHLDVLGLAKANDRGGRVGDRSPYKS